MASQSQNTACRRTLVRIDKRKRDPDPRVLPYLRLANRSGEVLPHSYAWKATEMTDVLIDTDII